MFLLPIAQTITSKPSVVGIGLKLNSKLAVRPEFFRKLVFDGTTDTFAQVTEIVSGGSCHAAGGFELGDIVTHVTTLYSMFSCDSIIENVVCQVNSTSVVGQKVCRIP